MKILLRPYDEPEVKEIEFHNDDFWNLDITLATIILASLKEFEDRTNRAFKHDDEYLIKYANVKNAFQMIVDKNGPIIDKAERAKVLAGLHDFAEIFQSLWT